MTQTRIRVWPVKKALGFAGPRGPGAKGGAKTLTPNPKAGTLTLQASTSIGAQFVLNLARRTGRHKSAAVDGLISTVMIATANSPLVL